MKQFKYLFLILFALTISCNNQQQPKDEQAPVKSTEQTQISPEDLSTIAFLTSIRIQEILDDSTHSYLEKIDLIKQATDEWGCMDKNAQNYNRFAKYDCCCIYTAPPSGGN